jgi:hypothetical protein
VVSGDAEPVEEVAGHPEPLRIARLAAGRQVEADVAPGEHARERLLPFADQFPEGVGEVGTAAGELAGAAVLRLLDPDLGQLRRIAHRERAQAHRVEELEDGRVGADAEREREDRHDREARIEAEEARAMLEVAPSAIEPADGVHLIDLLTHQGRVAQLAPGCVARLDGAHAAREVVVGLDGQMRVELARPLIVPAGAAKKARPGHF